MRDLNKLMDANLDLSETISIQVESIAELRSKLADAEAANRKLKSDSDNLVSVLLATSAGLKGAISTYDELLNYYLSETANSHPLVADCSKQIEQSVDIGILTQGADKLDARAIKLLQQKSAFYEGQSILFRRRLAAKSRKLVQADNKICLLESQLSTLKRKLIDAGISDSAYTDTTASQKGGE